MRGHLFDFQRDSFNSVRGKLRLRYHKRSYPKFPRYSNYDTGLRHDLGAFRSNRLVPTPRTDDDHADLLTRIEERVKEIAGCGIQFADALENFDDEFEDMLVQLRDLSASSDATKLRAFIVHARAVADIAHKLRAEMTALKKALGDDSDF